jgi:hypothetical protein
MKLWFRLSLVVGVLVGLLLGLAQMVGLNYPLPVLGSGSWFDRGRESVSGAPTVSLHLSSLQFDPARAAPLEFLVFAFALIAHNLGPPGQDTYGRPELMGPSLSCRSKRAAQSNAIGHFSANYWLKRSNLKNLGFATPFS